MSETYPNAAGRMADVAHYRFGTFDLDVKSGELRRNGVKIRLQEQPFQVLRKLLEGRGELVTREDLQGALWPADTFVDFETSLNTAIKRLREALGDSADLPVFIETVPRRGYRFLAPVQEEFKGNGKVIEIDNAEAATPTEKGLARGKRKRRAMLVMAICAAVIAMPAIGWYLPHAAPRVTDSAQYTYDGVSKGNLRVARGSIYFNELLGQQIALKKVPVGGGTPVTMSVGDPGLFLCDVSPDEMKFLVIVARYNAKGMFPIKVMDSGTSSLSDLHGLEGSDCTWGPGGKVVYSREEQVFMADGDGTHVRELLNAPGNVELLRFSPDGKTLRFTSTDKTTFANTLWEANADGSGVHEIFAEYEEFPQKCCGEWSSDGKYYFYRGVRDGLSRIFAVRERKFLFWKKEGTPVQLTTLPMNFYMGPPSEDGKKLYVTAAQPRARLERYDAKARQFLPYLGGISAGGVEESRDGKWVVYVKYPEQTLWRARADGSETLELTGPLLRAELPHWSPDGKHIAFSGARYGHARNVFLISPDGGAADQITSGSISDLDASCSPDGQTIVFGQIRAEGREQITSIQFLNVATRKQSTLEGSDGICCTRWSPDGKYLLATHPDNTDLELYEFATRKWSPILKNFPHIGYMEWASDSKSVIFDTYETREPAFFRLHVPDGRLETIASTENILRYYGEFGPWAGATTDGAPLLVRDVGIEEMYSLDLELP
jgi:DNA-binding winged helix-turn-helix (wHTH) protein/Tol biopolymer transport system component